ncbi:neuronal acetylcholine receptor subunit alpha-9-I-like [Argopecten irradians]|uniref:neuronal acetylcholine receptor subunit alpha-9-I-like n=1 Tax=Argopecten irradians TaxID=31199 RepID=UPI00371DFD31
MADMEKLDLEDFDVKINYAGLLDVLPGKLIKSTCTVDMTNFPTDYQTCNIVFVPWSYLPSEAQLTELLEDIMIVGENGEWDISGTPPSMNKSDPYRTNAAVYKLVLKRKSAYYIISMVVPVYILCFLNPFVFLLPASSGERISYTITMFLSLAVYMTLVGDNMPKVSEPMAGISFNYFLLVSMMFSCALTILTIFSLRWHTRKDASQFPKWLKRLVFLYTRKEEKRRTTNQENESCSEQNVD